MMTSKRKNRISCWMSLADEVAKMSEDPYCQVGAIGIRSDKSIAGLSYNGAPSGIYVDFSNRDERRKYVIHAETNLLRYIKPNECPLVAITLSPCLDCLRNLASYGVKQILFSQFYDKCDKKDLYKIGETYNIDLVHVRKNNKEIIKLII